MRVEAQTLAEILDGAVARAPQHVAVHFEGRAITYAELDGAADRIASALAERGIGAGDRVAIHLDNRPELIEIYLGVMRAGAILVPTNVMYTQEEMLHILGDSGARALFVLGALRSKFDAVRDRLAALETVVEVQPVTSRGLDFTAFAPSSARRQRGSVCSDDVAIIQYTSGTTGTPKGAMVTHGNIIAVLRNTSELPAIEASGPDDVTLLVLPLFHAYALNLVINRCFCDGQAIVLVNRFDAELVFSLIERQGVTIFYGAPPMYHAFVNTPGLERYDVSSLRYLYSGGAPLPVVILERMRERTGLEIFEGYGLSETAPTLTSNAAAQKCKPGSVGKPIPGVEIRLVDESDKDVPPGEVGEIVARGPNVFKGYWGRAQDTAEAMRGGWFHTGDLGRFDAEGYLYVVDRKKDMILVSGFNVYPVEVESVLMRHPQVVDCAVIGVPDAYRGESVRAVIVPKPGEQPDSRELDAWCRRRLAAFKVPRHYAFCEALPKSATGKVLKRELRNAVPRDE